MTHPVADDRDVAICLTRELFRCQCRQQVFLPRPLRLLGGLLALDLLGAGACFLLAALLGDLFSQPSLFLFSQPFSFPRDPLPTFGLGLPLALKCGLSLALGLLTQSLALRCHLSRRFFRSSLLGLSLGACDFGLTLFFGLSACQLCGLLTGGFFGTAPLGLSLGACDFGLTLLFSLLACQLCGLLAGGFLGAALFGLSLGACDLCLTLLFGLSARQLGGLLAGKGGGLMSAFCLSGAACFLCLSSGGFRLTLRLLFGLETGRFLRLTLRLQLGLTLGLALSGCLRRTLCGNFSFAAGGLLLRLTLGCQFRLALRLHFKLRRLLGLATGLLLCLTLGLQCGLTGGFRRALFGLLIRLAGRLSAALIRDGLTVGRVPGLRGLDVGHHGFQRPIHDDAGLHDLGLAAGAECRFREMGAHEKQQSEDQMQPQRPVKGVRIAPQDLPHDLNRVQHGVHCCCVPDLVTKLRFVTREMKLRFTNPEGRSDRSRRRLDDAVS